MNCRLAVVSCSRRQAIQDGWKIFQKRNWPDCPLPIDFISPEQDIGWNANLIQYLSGISESFVLLMLDDHFIDRAERGESLTENVISVLELMEAQPDIAMVKVQAGNAWPPELEVDGWPHLREYDRQLHPFKRTNLVPTIFRKAWLQRLSAAVLELRGPERDKGRNGALEFEVAGTLLTADTEAWPERMLGIHRPENETAFSVLTCIDNDAVREGRLKPHLAEILSANGIPLSSLEGFV